jgi:hypothetical protein
MKLNIKALALPMVAVAFGAMTLPASAQVVYYTTTNSAVVPSTVVSSPVTTYVDTSGYYTTRPVYTTTTPVYTNRIISQPAVLPSSAYVDARPRSNILGRTVGGAAVGAGVGALGGLVYGAITRERLGRAT